MGCEGLCRVSLITVGSRWLWVASGGAVLLECNCRVLDALQWWVQGDHGLRVVVPCFWGMEV